MLISICVGSSCHLKGSYEIVNIVQSLIKKYKIENEIELSASFCMERCANNGVSMTINNEFIEGCTPETIHQIFKEKVLDKLGVIQ